MAKIISAIMAVLMTAFAGKFTPVTVMPEMEMGKNAAVQRTTVMNFNVYVSGVCEKSPNNRTDEVAATIRKVNPDSFGLEEADEGWLQRLTVAMPEYKYVGLGRNDDFSGEASPVFYRADKFRCVENETIWLSKTPEVPSRGWDASIQRVATVAVLENRETGFRYVHINSHFDHLGVVSRNEAAAVISKKASEFTDIPVVFSGDLNAKEGTLMYQRLLSAGFRDTKKIAEITDEGATYHGYMGLDNFNNRPIDYIFVNSGCSFCKSYRIIRDEINGILPSDHYAVAVIVDLYNN